jgi:hypothetical protein
MPAKKDSHKKRGPKGGIKHQPARGHDRKGAAQKKKRFAEKAANKRLRDEAAAQRAWEEWDQLSDDVKRLLGPAGQPTMPRPTNGQ